MKIIADGVQESGGKLIGVSMEHFKHKARPNVDEMTITPDLSARKVLLLKKADAIVALAGGIGTLDEVTEVLALRRHGDHHKSIVFLNTEGFYEGIKMQLETMNREGFLGNTDNDVVPGLDGVAHFADTPEDAMRYIEEHGKD